MPVLSIATPELESHVFYPAIKQACHKFLYDLNLQDIVGKNIFIETGFSQPKNYNDGKHNVKLNINKLRVQAEINTNPQSLKWDSISFKHFLSQGISHTTKNRDYQTIFYDPTCNIRIQEMSLPTYISLNCTLSILDRNQAYQVPSMIYRHYPPNIPTMDHISYDYPIPKPTIALVYTLYKLKRFNKPNSFRTWLEMCSGNNTQFAINRVATKEELVTKRILIDSLYMVDYQDNKPNEIVINRSPTQYDFNFTIHLQFSRPDLIIMDYPIVLDNRLLPGELIPDHLHRNEPIPNLIGPYPDNITNEYVDKYDHGRTKPVMIKFPDYDDWEIPTDCYLYTNNRYRPWFSCIFTMDEDSEYTELPIGGLLDEELGYQLHPMVKDILKMQGKLSFDDNSLFNITIFNDDIPVEKTYLQIDENLTIKVKCVDPAKTRRLVISELLNFKYLGPEFTILQPKIVEIEPNIKKTITTTLYKEIVEVVKQYMPEKTNTDISNPDIQDIPLTPGTYVTKPEEVNIPISIEQTSPTIEPVIGGTKDGISDEIWRQEATIIAKRRS